MKIIGMFLTLSLMAWAQVLWDQYDAALYQRAKESGKLVMVEVMSPNCKYCRYMDEEVFSDEEVADVLNRDFLSVKVDKNDPVPFKTAMVPSFFFVDPDSGEVVKKVIGAWAKGDFLQVLNEVKGGRP